jgi:hypothetical protein
VIRAAQVSQVDWDRSVVAFAHRAKHCTDRDENREIYDLADILIKACEHAAPIDVSMRDVVAGFLAKVRADSAEEARKRERSDCFEWSSAGLRTAAAELRAAAKRLEEKARERTGT